MKRVGNETIKLIVFQKLTVLLVLVTGCSSIQKDTQEASPPKAWLEPSERVSLEILGVEVKNQDFDIPIESNHHVERWAEYFTTRGKPFFETYLRRAKYFIPYIEPILEEEGLPRDLVYLAMIESGFNTRARSRARAVGAWQFISATGRAYGLQIDWWVDERKDIAKSTRAAVQYLKYLYSQFGSWELAASAYNAGEFKVARAIRRYRSMDFWTLIRHRFLRPETRNYVPKMMAAAVLAKNPHLFDLNHSENVVHKDDAIAPDGSIVHVDHPEEVSRVYGVELENQLKKYREEFHSEFPAEFLGEYSRGGREIPHITRSGDVGGERLAEFRVQSPADLLQIAKAAGLTYKIVKKLNPEIKRWVTPPNQSHYKIKLPLWTKEKFLVRYNHPDFPRKVKFRAYTVRRGDNLRRIARRFRIGITGITDLNGFSRRTPLRRGQKILLPMPEDRTRSMASLELRDPPRRRRYRKRRAHRQPAIRQVSYGQLRSQSKRGI